MDRKMDDICFLKERLIDFAKQHSECAAADIPVYGEVIDMIKDCYEMEEKCWKACYYKEIVEAMKEENESGPYGYDRWRYPSSGRFARKGSGVRMGYIPKDPDKMPWYDPMFKDMRNDSMMDRPYDQYMESRRHYHETKSPEDKKEMEHHAKEHVEEVEDSLRDIWEESTPELRKEMKRNLTNLVNSLPA